jgi:drug/metabolite transporter (DMT)-like permease
MRIPNTIAWGVALAVVTALISGVSIFLNGRFVKLFDDPTLLAAVRNGAVGICLLVLAGATGALRALPRLDRRAALMLLAIGVIGGGIPFALFFNGLALSTSPAAAIIHKTMFIWVAVLAVPLLGERLGLAQIAALGLLLAGTLVLAPAGSLGTGIGEAMILLATLLWAVEVIAVRRVLGGGVPAGLAAAARMTVGAVTLFALVAAGRGLDGLLAFGAEQWAAILVTGALLTGFVATWYAALERAPAVTVTSVLVAGAAVTTGLQAATTGSLPPAPALAGNLLLIVGGGVAILGAQALLKRSRVSAISARPAA